MTDRKSPAAGSYEAFLAEKFAPETETIRGVEVRIPTDVPLAVEMRLKELQESESEEDMRELVALLFGGDVLDAWRDAGMGAMEFQTVIAWAMARTSGAPVTFNEAYDIVVEASASEGKAQGPNRAARRSASKKPSTGTGGRSARTSAASTASRRKSSPR